MAVGGACKKNASVSPAKAAEQLLAWNLKTTVGAYDTAGFTNVAWDYSARQCLNEFARVRGGALSPDEPWAGIIASNAITAVEGGCKDPMIDYLFIKFAMSQEHTKEEFSARMYKNSKNMYDSAYPVARKCYAQLRALEQLNFTYGTNSDFRTERFELASLLLQSAPETLEDKTLPPKEAYELSDGVLYQMSGDKANYEFFYKTIEQPLFKNWPDSYAPWLVKGNYYVGRAWQERGGGYADSISKEAGEQFLKNMAEARKALERAWKLDPMHSEIAEDMLKVILAEGGRDQMELWFNRAMDLNTNDYSACQQKLNFISPYWYGSNEAMLAFGRECVQSTKWGGRVPIILVDAHISINSMNDPARQTEYWKQPEVWADVESAYERVFDLNPNDTSLYQNYAWYAYHAEQWDKLHELIPRLGPANYAFFGGQQEFEKMVSLTRKHVNSK
jgi:hypothetical protein